MAPSPGPPAAWYPDPTDPGRLRWWDGRRWTEHVALGGLVLPEPSPVGSVDDRPSGEAAWHRDPSDPHRLRWWDGSAWTDHVAADGTVAEVPLTLDEVTLAAQQDERAPWPGWVAGAGLGLGLASALLAGVLVVLGDAAGLHGEAASLALASLGLYSGLALTCWWVHHRCRTGRSFRADFGLRYRAGDWWRGLVGAFAARTAVAVVIFLFLWFVEDPTTVEIEVFDDGEITTALLVAFGVTALVLAPVVEELYFRGLLMRSLEVVAPAWLAVAVQAGLFGLAHSTASLGTGDLVVVCSTAAAGAVFGIVVRRHRRLGPAIAAHAWFNLVAFVALLALLD